MFVDFGTFTFTSDFFEPFENSIAAAAHDYITQAQDSEVSFPNTRGELLAAVPTYSKEGSAGRSDSSPSKQRRKSNSRQEITPSTTKDSSTTAAATTENRNRRRTKQFKITKDVINFFNCFIVILVFQS